MFSFEGDFKTRPKVSLGGASRKVRIGACVSVFVCVSVSLVPSLPCLYVFIVIFTVGPSKMGATMTKA